jgi:hypothetical protein
VTYALDLSFAFYQKVWVVKLHVLDFYLGTSRHARAGLVSKAEVGPHVNGLRLWPGVIEDVHEASSHM